MKVFTVAAAIEKGMSPNSIFFCENGQYPVDGFTVHDTHAYEWLSVSHIIKFSSNIGATKISETIGPKALHHYLAAFGFGEKTGLASPGESCGSLMPHEKWTRIDTSAISFGQGRCRYRGPAHFSHQRHCQRWQINETHAGKKNHLKHRNRT